MARRPWIERTFELGLAPGALPSIIERLRRVPDRLAALVDGQAADTLTRRFDEAWSIQENVGHLIDLEPLGDGRLDQLLAGKSTLTAADMTNQRTEEAGHNSAPIKALLAEFERGRAALVARLEALSEEEAGLSALHPRLQTPMSATDLFFFIAEHDDHHLARVEEIVRRHGALTAVEPADMLRVALAEARLGLAEGGIPIGAALFDGTGYLLGRGHNRRVQEDDPSVHGETDAFRKAGRQADYRSTTMVTTLAPCWYCSGLVRQFGIGRVVVGESVNFAGGVEWLRRHGVEVIDLASDECIELLSSYIAANPAVWNEDIGETDE